MSTEEHKDLVRKWIALWETGNVADVDFGDFVADDFVRHDPNIPAIHGPEAEKGLVMMFLTAFPDLRFTIAHLIAEGDLVQARGTAVGTHRGELMGIPPTDRQVTVTISELFRLADGKIAEQWVVMDTLGMLQQLGAIPEAGQA
jgi:steroid delta-isomerase-like uncharacterized protein